MILTCPACSTRYAVPDGAIGPDGRTVRCASCGHVWKELPPPALIDAAPPAPARAPHQKYRAKVEAAKRTDRMISAGGVWAAAGVVFLGALAAAVWFRVDVVRAWPKAASAYAMIGMKTNIFGLEIENVMAERAAAPAPPGVTVSGVVRNVTQDEQAVPLLRVALFDATARELAFWTVDPGLAALSPGARAPFVTALADPPPGVAKVEVTFADEAAPDARPAVVAPPAAPGPQPPAAKAADAG